MARNADERPPEERPRRSRRELLAGAAGTTPGQTRHGIHGVTDASAHAGVFAEHMAGGIGVHAESQVKPLVSKGVLGIGYTGVQGIPLSGGTGSRPTSLRTARDRPSGPGPPDG